MKLSQYAKTDGIPYCTAFRWWQNGQIRGFQQPSDTIMVTEGEDEASVATKGVSPVVISARVSSPKQHADLDPHVQRLQDACAARGYQGGRIVNDIGSGVNDRRRTFLALLADPTADLILVEHKHRAPRCDFRSLDGLLTQAGHAIEVATLAEHDRQDLLHDLSSIVPSMCARLSGQRRAKRTPNQRVRDVEAEDAAR